MLDIVVRDRPSRLHSTSPLQRLNQLDHVRLLISLIGRRSRRVRLSHALDIVIIFGSVRIVYVITRESLTGLEIEVLEILQLLHQLVVLMIIVIQKCCCSSVFPRQQHSLFMIVRHWSLVH